MKYLTSFMRVGTSKLSGFIRGVLDVGARLFGIRQTEDGYDSSQLSSAVWIFAIGIPVGLFLAGMNFPITIWAAVVFGTLAIVNLDEALVLTASYTEKGNVASKEGENTIK